MRSLTVAVFLLVSLPEAALAKPAISDISGALNEAEISLAIATRQAWLDRADNNCIDKSSSGCDIRLAVQIPPAGKSPRCKVEETNISSKTISSLYCKVILTMDFFGKPAPTSFKLHFNSDSQAPPFQASEGATKGVAISSQGGYLEAHVVPPAPPPCPDSKGARDSESIRLCFDQYGGRLNHLYQQGLRSDPLLTGSLKMAMKIEANGTVSEVVPTIESGYFDKVFIEKSIEVIKSINFGKASERKEMSHTFNFLPG